MAQLRRIERKGGPQNQRERDFVRSKFGSIAGVEKKLSATEAAVGKQLGGAAAFTNTLGFDAGAAAKQATNLAKAGREALADSEKIQRDALANLKIARKVADDSQIATIQLMIDNDVKKAVAFDNLKEQIERNKDDTEINAIRNR